MLTGPTQPEMGRLRISESIRRSEANRRAGALARARGEERRARMRDAFRSMITAVRARREPAPRPIRTATIETPC